MILYELSKKIKQLCSNYIYNYEEKHREKCITCGGNIDTIGHGIKGCVKCGKPTEIWENGKYVKR